MNGMKRMAFGLMLIAAPVVAHAQKPDTVKPVKTDTIKKESTAEKVGRQTGTSIDKAAKTTERNAKVLGKRTADNTKEGYKETKADVGKAASKAGKATKTNARHLKAKLKKAVGKDSTE
jgi:hypothetical protein